MMMYPLQFVSAQICEMSHTLPIPPIDGIRIVETIDDNIHPTMHLDFSNSPIRAKTKQPKKLKDPQHLPSLKIELTPDSGNQQQQQLQSTKMIYECDLCKKVFSSQSSLWKHEKTHSGERPYICTMCKKAFTQLANLQRHYFVHNGKGLKPYKCPYCDRPFSQQANMIKHQMLHTGEKPYKCVTCDKQFSQRANLKKHEMIHTGERPHECPLCSKSYAQYANMKKHLLTHDKPTKGRKLQCNKCLKECRSSQEYKEHTKECQHTVLQDEYGNPITFEIRHENVKAENLEMD